MNAMRRRGWLKAVWQAGWLSVPWRSAGADEAQPPTLAFLGFELQDEQPDPAHDAEHRARLALIDRQMSAGLQQLGLYRVLDLAPAQRQIAQARAENEFLYRCNQCLGPVGQALDTSLVGLGWVQRIGNLILNLNIEIRDVRSDRQVLTKSVDIRGDNDRSWQHGVAYMLRDMAERRQREPRYGR